MYFFVYRNLHIGGVETLLMRECNWFKKRDNVCIISQNVSGVMKTELVKHRIKLVQLEKWTASAIYETIMQISQKINFIKFYHFKDFLEFEMKYEKYNIRCFYYCVHPANMFFFQAKPKLKNILGSIIADYIIKFVESKNIIFMDEDVIDSSLNYYNISYLKDNCTVVLLPFKIEKHSFKKKSSKSFNILAVARADFPYKGYVLGLIDEFNNSIDLFQNAHLTIISTGDDVNELISKINSVSEKTKLCIEFINGINHEKLSSFYAQTDLYVGMGTTILEATSYGVPSLVASYGTRLFSTVGFFYENPKIIGSKFSNMCSGLNRIIEAYNMPSESYEEIQNKSFNALKDYYDEDKILERFNNWEFIRSKKKIAFMKKTVLKLYFKIHSLYFG